MRRAAMRRAAMRRAAMRRAAMRRHIDQAHKAGSIFDGSYRYAAEIAVMFSGKSCNFNLPPI